MNEKVLIDRGGEVQFRQDTGAPVRVPFPVCLAIKYGNEVPETCPDFVLDVEAGWVFIRTLSPLPAGARLTLHFYIPPETKLLAQVRGTVSAENIEGLPAGRGMLIRFSLLSRRALVRLEQYMHRERLLVNRMA